MADMSKIKVFAFQPPYAGRLDVKKEHPARIVINFDEDERGATTTPMKHQQLSPVKLSEREVQEIYRQMLDGAACGELPNGTVWYMLRHLG